MEVATAEGGDDPVEEVTTSGVRPYTVTRGRTRSEGEPIALEALVESLVKDSSGPDLSLPTEQRRILELTATEYQSVAELSARVRLPVGVIRVLIADLVESGKVRVHGTGGTSALDAATSLRVLESVLDGISSL